MRLKTVVLPDPLGPMSAVIEPSGTANEQSSTARTPPKRLSQALDLEQRPPGADLVGDGRLALAHDERRFEPRADDRVLAPAPAAVEPAADGRARSPAA